jgi:hypothetical protein
LERAIGRRTRWIDSVGVGADYGNTDSSRDVDVYGPGERLFIAGPDDYKIVEHHNYNISGTGADRHEFARRRANRDGLFGDFSSDGRDDAVQLERECGIVARRPDAFNERNDFGNTDSSRDVDVYGPGERLFIAGPDGYKIAEHHRYNNSRSRADHHQFARRWASRDGLFGDADRDRWDDAVHLDLEYGILARRSDASNDRDDFGNADRVRNLQFHGQGHGFEFASEHRYRQLEHYHHPELCGSFKLGGQHVLRRNGLQRLP